MRFLRRRLRQATCRPTTEYLDASGSAGRVMQPMESSFSFQGVLLAPQRRITRVAGGVRLATTWLFVPEGWPATRELDYLFLVGEPRGFVVTAIRSFPRHLEYTLERIP